MKENFELEIFKKFLFNLPFILMIFFVSSYFCEISISKLNKDVMKDFNGYHHAIFLNKTHFSCDEGKNVLLINKFNDDFCDCNDGSDENRTNACMNGKFVCFNRFYEKKLISTNKVNDGICDCCDGSDEFPNLNCPKNCLESSQKEYERLSGNFNTLKIVIDGFTKETQDKYFESNSKFIDETNSIYNRLKELREKKYLLKSYLTKLENSLIEDDKEFVDENDIKYGSLLKAYQKIDEKISFYEQNLLEIENDINNLFKFTILKDIAQHNLTTKYKYFDCEFNFIDFRCRGSKDSASRWKHRNLGHYDSFEDNVIYFKGGDSCHYYNKSFSVKIFLECSTTESFEFINKYEGCSFEFVYNSNHGCNSIMLKNIMDRIKLLLSEV